MNLIFHIFMSDIRESWNGFLREAADCEEEARTLLCDFDRLSIAKGIKPFNLAVAENGEILDALCRAMAIVRIGKMTEAVRTSMQRHAFFGHLDTITTCTAILLASETETPPAIENFDVLISKLRPLI